MATQREKIRQIVREIAKEGDRQKNQSLQEAFGGKEEGSKGWPSPHKEEENKENPEGVKDLRAAVDIDFLLRLGQSSLEVLFGSKRLAYLNSLDYKSGIYCIINCANKRLYFGSAKNLKQRHGRHCLALKYSKASPYLQNDYNKSSNNFLFVAIQKVDDCDLLLQAEQKWLNQYHDNQAQCYNIAKIAGSSAGVRVSEVTKAKLSKLLKARHKTDQVYICKMKNVAEARKKRFQLIDPENNLVDCAGINATAKKFNLNTYHLSSLVNEKGKLKSHKGWRLPKNINHDCSTGKAKTYNIDIISPKGERFEIFTNMKLFCKNNSLNEANFRKFLLDKNTIYKGWKHGK